MLSRRMVTARPTFGLEHPSNHLKHKTARERSSGEMLSIEEAVSSLERRSALPDVENFICILQECRNQKNMMCAKRLHAYMCKMELETHAVLGNYLVPMLVECGSLADAQQVFSKLVYRNRYSWNSLILGYTERGKFQKVFQLYETMQDNSVQPDSHTFMALLKACARLKCVQKAQQVRAEIGKYRLEGNLFVGSALVDLLGKCGLLKHAREIFDKMLVRNVVSWNALINGYAEHALGEQALTCFEQMKQDDVPPNAVTYAISLKACGSTGNIEKGRRIGEEIAQMGLETDSFVGCALVDMFGNCGSLMEAQEMFEILPVQDVVSWSALIAGYAERGLGEKALNCLEQMKLECVTPNAVTFVSSLKACAGIKAIERGQEIHLEVTRRGLEGNPFVGNALVDMLCKCGAVAEAQGVFDKLLVQDVISWSSLISGYAEHRLGEQALQCLEQMQLEGVSPNAVTFVCSVRACGSTGVTEMGRKLRAEIARKGLECDPFVGSALVDMFGKFGSFAEALEVFDKLAVRDVVSWNGLMGGYAEHGFSGEALDCFEQMQYEGISPNAVTFVCSLKVCAKMRDLEKGRKIRFDISKRRLEGDIFVGNTLIDMFCKCGSLTEAQEVFDRLQSRDVVSWSSMIAGYVKNGLGEEALSCFEQMHFGRVSPNAVTFVCTLKACGNTGATERGRQIHVVTIQMGLEREPFVANALVDFYGKCGLVEEAQKVFDVLPVRDVISWSSMIKGYGINHEGNMAVCCFEDMQRTGVMPNAVTFTCLLVACSHSCLVSKGQDYFNMMREHQIEATMDHYACMVDLLARAGHLSEAMQVVESMQCPPSKEMWTSLLSACGMFGKVELGWLCFQQLAELNPDDAAAYVLMANIYACVSCWDKAHGVEKLRTHAGAKKIPASALIEVNKKLHEFVMSDKQSKEISEMLEKLSACMKNTGYVPHVSLFSKFSPMKKEVVQRYDAEYGIT